MKKITFNVFYLLLVPSHFGYIVRYRAAQAETQLETFRCSAKNESVNSRQEAKKRMKQFRNVSSTNFPWN